MTRLFALLTLLFLPALAFAQSVAPTPAATDPLVITTVLVAISGLMAFLRSVAPNESWAHTKVGAVILAGLGAALAAVYGAVQSHGLDGRAALIAALGAIGTLVGVANPSAKAIAKGAALVLPLLLVLGGCGHISPNVKQYDAALTACLASNGVSALPSLETQVLQILEAGGSSASQIETSIESVAIAAGGDAAVLVANCAVQAWLDQHPALPANVITPSQGAARIFLAKTGKGHAFRAPIGGSQQ